MGFRNWLAAFGLNREDPDGLEDVEGRVLDEADAEGNADRSGPGWPESGEVVVGRVVEVTDSSAVVALSEYPDKQGFCDAPYVASGWVENVRDHLSEGQTVVARVIDVDGTDGLIDISLRDVTAEESEKRRYQLLDDM